jgi:hypothetical protein
MGHHLQRSCRSWIGTASRPAYCDLMTGAVQDNRTLRLLMGVILTITRGGLAGFFVTDRSELVNY